MVNKFIIDDLTDNELLVHRFMYKKYMFNNLTMLEKRLLIMNNQSSHCPVDFIQFVEDYNIGLIFLPPHATFLLQHLNSTIFETLANAYCLESDEWQ